MSFFFNGLITLLINRINLFSNFIVSAVNGMYVQGFAGKPIVM